MSPFLRGLLIGGGIGTALVGAVGGIVLLAIGKPAGWLFVAAAVIGFYIWQDVREW